MDNKFTNINNTFENTNLSAIQSSDTKHHGVGKNEQVKLIPTPDIKKPMLMKSLDPVTSSEIRLKEFDPMIVHFNRFWRYPYKDSDRSAIKVEKTPACNRENQQ